jgi:predicted transcriptional regulator
LARIRILKKLMFFLFPLTGVDFCDIYVMMNDTPVIFEPDTFMTEPVHFNPKRFRGNMPRKSLALRLCMAGRLVYEAAEDVGISTQTLSNYINSQAGQDEIKVIRAEYDEEFKNLYASAIQVIRECMKSPDPVVKLNAANTWLRHSKEIKVDIVLSAEDIIQKLMKGEALPNG